MSDALTISIHIQASPATIFPFLSDPQLLSQWLGPEAIAAKGTVRESTPNARIVFGWGYEAAVHGIAPDSTIVTIELTPTATGTTVTLTHAGLDAAQQANHRMGWTHYLSQLAGAAASRLAAEKLPVTIENYIHAWNEPAETDRAARLDACWEEDGTFRDSMGAVDGRDALFTYIGNARQYVPGFQLELAAPPEHCHGYYRFSWLIRMPGGGIMGRGTNFGQLGSSGRIASAVGFWDKP
ncbi:MAG: SRPBCC domain-containing protein [Bryobacterales bacterium]|nr:SRPBCC domain-containing protein [Bryobacterales bacterium]